MNSSVATEDVGETGWAEFAVWTGQGDYLAAAGEKFRTVALVGIEMRELVTKNGLVAPTQMSEREGIGRRAC